MIEEAGPGKHDPERPWLGLISFGVENQHLFYGRSSEIRDLYRRVHDHPLTVLYGQSGRGKTSLLSAGLVPRLTAEGYRPILLRLRFDSDAPPLRDQVAVVLNDRLGESAPVPQETFLLSLWERTHGLVFSPLMMVTNPPVLIFDQFEEVFTLVQDERHDRRGELQQLMTELADLVENRPPAALRERLSLQRDLAEDYDFTPAPIRVLISLREDYLAQLENFAELMPALMRNRQSLHELNGPSALEAVVEPGRLGGRNLISSEVGERIVRFVARASLETPIVKIEAVPPLLSLVCFELNEARIREGAEAVSLEQVDQQSADILQSFYERSFAGLPVLLRNFVEDRLLTRSGHRNSVAREDAAAELQQVGVDDPFGLLDQLIAGRLLSAEEHGGVQRLELTHDVLAPLALQSRSVRQERDHAERGERERESQIRVERERMERVRLKLFSAVTAVLALIGLMLAINNWRLTRDARLQAAVLQVSEASRLIEKPGRLADGIDLLAQSISGGADLRSASASLAAVLERPPIFDGRGGPGLAVFDISTSSRQILPPLKHDAEVASAVFSPDGWQIVTVTNDGVGHIWNSFSGARLFRLDVRKQDITGAGAGRVANRLIPVGFVRQGPSEISSDAYGEHPCLVHRAGYSPDGTRVVTADASGGVWIWDSGNGRRLGRPINHQEPVNWVDFSPDGRKLVTASDDESAQIWDSASGYPLTGPLKHRGSVCAAAFSPDGRRVVTASDDNTAQIWDSITGQPLKGPLEHMGPIYAVAFSSDGRRVVTASADKTARIWDSASGRALNGPLKHGGAVYAVDFSPDGLRVVTASADKAARVWDVASAELINELQHQASVRDVAFSPDGRRIITTSSANDCAVWEGESRVAKLIHEGQVDSASFSHDGRRIVTASRDKTARVWEVADHTPTALVLEEAGNTANYSTDGSRVLTTYIETEDGSGRASVRDARTGVLVLPRLIHSAAINQARFSPDGQFIVTASDDMTARVWDAQSGRARSPSLLHKSRVLDGRFSPDGNHLVTASSDGTVQIWDARAGKKLNEFRGRLAPALSAAFSPDPDGRYVVIVGEDDTAQIWDRTSDASEAVVLQHEDPLHSAVFSPNGSWVLTASANTARIWEARTGKLVGRPMIHDGIVYDAAFSPDGRRVATATWIDQSVRIWDAQTGMQLTPPLDHETDVNNVQFSQDGRWLVSASDDGARIWDVETGLPLGPPLRHDGVVMRASISPDRQQVLTSGATGVRIWPLIDYSEARKSDLVEILGLLVDCETFDESTSTARCHTVVPDVTKLTAVIDQVPSKGLRASLRYHLLNDARAHPLVVDSTYPNDLIRFRTDFSVGTEQLVKRDQLAYWWRTTHDPDLGAAWVLQAATLADSVADAVFWLRILETENLSTYSRENLRIAKVLFASLGSLRTGLRDQPLWKSHEFVPFSDFKPAQVVGEVAVAVRAIAPASLAPDSRPILRGQYRKIIGKTSDDELDRILDVLSERKPSDSEAREFRAWLQAHSDKNPVAAYALAILFNNQLDQEIDWEEAHKLAMYAARSGLTPAQNFVGYNFYHAQGAALDLYSARDWYEKACKSGLGTSCNNLGSWTNDVLGNPVDAVRYYRRGIDLADESGYSDLNLATHLTMGHGVDRELLAAMDLTRRAAEKGHPDASYSYAANLDYGLVTDPNPAAAIPWYARAALRHGESRASYRLGQLYESGVGDMKDEVNAARWYRIAAIQGHSAAYYALARLIFSHSSLCSQNKDLAELARAKLTEANHYDWPESNLDLLQSEARLLDSQLTECSSPN